MEVDADRQPAEGEVIIFTIGGGGFVVKGTMREIAAKLNADDWTDLELAESGDHVVVRSDKVVALRSGTRAKRGAIGFVHRE